MATNIIGQGTTAPMPQQQGCPTAFNLEQLQQVLQTIARRADVARNAIWYAVDSDKETLAAAAEAAATIMTSIGAMADSLSGATVVGDADSWNFGPGFANFGKAVSHD